MRTNSNAIVTNCTVIGFGQDSVVVSLRNESCAPAAQHLAHRHASKRSRGTAKAFKRRGDYAAAAGAVSEAMAMRQAITGPQWQPVRLTSPGSITG